jgi:hypothetical protein
MVWEAVALPIQSFVDHASANRSEVALLA